MNIRPFFSPFAASDRHRAGSYQDKYFSFLGDSISTLEGVTPPGYSVFYDAATCRRAGISGAQDTWWGILVEALGAKLLACDAWSGCRVSVPPSRHTLFPSGCSDGRIAGLGRKDTPPDVIIVYLGTNDWGCGVPVRYDRKLGLDARCFFDRSYDWMLEKIRNRYPHAALWCCTLCPTYIPDIPEHRFSFKLGGNHLDAYNRVIRKTARRHGAGVIDLRRYGIPYAAMDGIHPSAQGMRTLASLCLRSLRGE